MNVARACGAYVSREKATREFERDYGFRIHIYNPFGDKISKRGVLRRWEKESDTTCEKTYKRDERGER